MDRGTDCVRAVKRNIALGPMKAHFFSNVMEISFANELYPWAIKFCQMQRGVVPLLS